MSFFTQVTAKVEIDAENSVVVRKMTYGEQQKIIGANNQIEMDQDNTRKSVLDVAGMRADQLVACIVSWEGPGFEGRPPTRANILALPPEIAEIIDKKVQELNTSVTEEEEKN